MPAAPLDLVRAWFSALESFDTEALTSLVDDAIEIHTMHRGVLRGPEAVREWGAKQGYGVAMHFTPRLYFQRDQRVVVDLLVEFRFVENGESAGSADGAGAFAPLGQERGPL